MGIPVVRAAAPAEAGAARILDDATVLFSGGRDSSLAAILLAARGIGVHLLTCDNGATIHGEVTRHRVEELRAAFDDRIRGWVIHPTHALFRQVALIHIERDFATYQVNLVVLGSQLATLTEGILYCLEHGITSLAVGFTAYQSHFAEQTPVAISLFEDYCNGFGIRFLTPTRDRASADSVRESLLAYGVSTKSLEGFSIFSDTFSDPSPEQVDAYIREKLPLCRAHVRSMLQAKGIAIEGYG
jgi:7-cyano-7-deazaguanine synthase in queuosine biosynthesis